MRKNYGRPALLAAFALCPAFALPVQAAATGARGDSMGAARRAPTAAAERTTVKMPFVPLRGHGGPLVEVDFGKHVIGHFLIDTGASFSCVTDTFAKKLHLKPIPAYLDEGGIQMGSDHGSQSFYVKVPSIDVGMTFTDCQFIIISSHEFFDFGEESVDGLIGGDLLKQTALFIDYPRNELTMILPGGLSAGEVANLGFGKAARVPLRNTSHDPHRGVSANSNITLTDIHLHADGREATEDIAIDTGAPTTSVSQSVAARIGLRASGKEAASTMGDGSVYGNVAVVPSLSLGDLTLTDFKVTYPGRTHGREIPPLLGEDILSYCAVLFDWQNGTLYLKPTLPPLLASARTGAIDASAIDSGRLRAAAGTLPGVALGGVSFDAPAADTDETAGDPGARISALRAKLTRKNSDAAGWDRLGDLLRRMKQDDKATTAYRMSVDLYREALVAKPTDGLLLVGLSGALTDVGEEGEGEKTARDAISAMPERAEPQIALGWALHARAVRVLTGRPRSVRLDYDDLGPFRALVETLRGQPPPDAAIAQTRRLEVEARTAFDQAIAAQPSRAKSYYARAEYRADSALAVDATLQALKGEDVPVLGLVFSTGYVDDLAAAAERDPADVGVQIRAAQAAADAPFARNEHGIDLRDEKFWQSLPQSARKTAEVCIARVEAMTKNANPAVAARGTEALAVIELKVKHNPDGAAALLDRALALDPTSSNAANGRAGLLSERRQFSAIQTLFGTLTPGTDSDLKRLWLCYAATKLHDWDRAQENADAALRLSPGSYAANIAVARVSLRRSAVDSTARLARSKECLDRVGVLLAANPDEEKELVYRRSLALYDALTGDAAKARDIACACLVTSRTDTEARDILGAILR